jgi:outer membrane protein assembly factor BamB
VHHLLSNRFLVAVLAAGAMSLGSGAARVVAAPTLRPGTTPATISWPQTGFDAGHTGFNPNESTLTTANVIGLTRSWASGPGGTYSNPIVGSGLVVLVTRGGGFCTGVRVLKAATGQLVWSHAFKAFQCTNPVLTGDVVSLISNNPWRLYSWKLQSGSKFVNKQLPRTKFSDLTTAGGRLYYDGANGWVHAIDPSTGRQWWAYKTGAGLTVAAPALHGAVVYVASARGKVFAIGTGAGKLRWSKSLPMMNSMMSTSADLAATGNRLFAVCGNGGVYALDTTRKGHVIWSLQGIEYNTELAVGYGSLYITAPPQGPHGQGPSVFALSQATGKQVWSFTTGYVDAKPSVADGMVFVSNDNFGPASTFFALKASSGAKLWSATGAGSYPSYPAIIGGRVYLSNMAFGLSGTQ